MSDIMLWKILLSLFIFYFIGICVHEHVKKRLDFQYSGQYIGAAMFFTGVTMGLMTAFWFIFFK